MLRVGMLTSGGDCQALNAAMRGVAKSLFNQCSEVEIYGFTDGYKGLIYGEYRLLKMMIFRNFKHWRNNPWKFKNAF